jgi:hypothetical protein
VTRSNFHTGCDKLKNGQSHPSSGRRRSAGDALR